jgi:hypothetical protein
VEKILDNYFGVLYENNATASYLVLRADACKSLINYQVQMLLNNKLNGLLDFNINHIGEDVNCFYNVTSKCTLASFISRKHFMRDEFLITILNIINNIYQIKSHLLYENNILLDENFIYVEPENIDIYFVYLPFSGCKNDLKAFFIKLIVKMVKFYDEDSDNYFQKIMEVIKGDLFNLSTLKELVEKLLGDGIKSNDSDNQIINLKNNGKTDFGSTKNESYIQDSKSYSKAGKNKDGKSDINKAQKASIAKTNIKIPKSRSNDNEKNGSDLAAGIKDAYANGTKDQNKNLFPVFITVILQLLLLAVFIIAINSNLVKMSDSPRTTAIILSVIFLSMDTLFIRIIKERKKSLKFSKSKTVEIIADKMRTGQNAKAISLISSEHNSVDTEPGKLIPSVNEGYNGETVILKRPACVQKPFLKEKDGEEVIEINKKNILIGRLGSFVDYVINNSAIGKIHAEITNEGTDFYVMDCNSKNGTFLNDSRIVPNTKNKVTNNDVLRFANKEFIFFIP